MDKDIPFSVVVPTAYGPMIVNRNDINQTNALFKTGFAESRREISLLAHVLSLCGTNTIVVDIGANIGTHTIALARAVGPQGRIHAFEPQRILFNMMCGSVALNSLMNVYCYNMAVGDREGSIEIPQYDYSKPLNFGSIEFGHPLIEKLAQERGHDPNRVEFVQLTTLDRFSFGRIDLLKIDVEGMEMQVLDGAAATISRCTPVLYVEFVKVDRELLARRISAWGYSVHQTDMNYLCIPPRLKEQIKVVNAGNIP
jgi:FkbM family methyltransferase